MKYFISILVILICIITFNLLNNKDDNKVEAPVKELQLLVKKGNAQEKPTTNNNGIVDVVEKKVVLNFIDLDEQIEGMSSCGYDNTKKLSDQEIGLLTDKQKRAESKLANYCFNWFDYIATLTKEELDSIKDLEKMAIKRIDVFFDENLSSEEKFASAIQSIEDDPTLHSFPAVLYLLENDFDLIKELLDGINSKSYAFIQSPSVSTDIAMLYTCEEGLSTWCRKDGFLMLELCITDDSVCEMNYGQYLSTKYSYNQFIDISNITLHLRRLINDGYPGIPIDNSD